MVAVGPDELTRIIAERRARDLARRRYCPPNHVRIGTLTATVMDDADWRGQDEFPSSQHVADEVEKVLAYVVAKGQFRRYLGALRGRKSQFDSALFELRVAFYGKANCLKMREDLAG